MPSKQNDNNHINTIQIMDASEFDFEGNHQTTTQVETEHDDDTKQETQTEQETESLDGDSDKADVTSEDNSKTENQNENDDDNSSTGELNAGDSIEFDGATYTVAENGDLVDKDGKVFKEAKDVAEWLKSVDVEDNKDIDGALNLASIQEALGVTVTDAEGKAVEFTDDANGVKAYVNSVIDLKSNELQTAAINKLYADNPLLKQFQDYVQLTGTPRGFGDIPDRSGIRIDKDNVAQQVAIVRMAAQEFGNKSLNDNYIKYLQDSGGLYDEAKNLLSSLVEKDKAVRADIEQRAEAQRQEEEQSVATYWKNVNDVINNRIVAGYKLPESFTKEVNGQKLIFTPNDFYTYLSKATETDANGNRITGYQRDLNKLSDNDYLNRELLDAWLMYTGGSYKDLVDMAVKEDKVRQLRVKSKEQHSAKSVKVIRKQTGKANIDDIVL